jgi:hypothetical protein
MEPTFFATPEDFRAWLQEHHETESELLVGFHKKGSGRPSITWPESVDQALCFGLGLVPGAARRLPAHRHPLGHQRQTARDQGAPAAAAHRRLGGAPDGRASHAPGR